MTIKYIIDEDCENVTSNEVCDNEFHQLKVSVDERNSDIYLSFSSRESMRDFALSLLHESAYGSGWAELYPLGFEGKQLVVNGVRLSPDSSRIFIDYPKAKK
ncbi:hypothetical protein [Neptunomonas sp. XY-337]|uniref:hypothetical protein n=1 Tax=Neptunomonas sp. XY-337 TaxID=2561897 RepID=UPI0010AB114F|nr:hypothetical protein [Neptunomonas sp. XY-337]